MSGKETNGPSSSVASSIKGRNLNPNYSHHNHNHNHSHNHTSPPKPTESHRAAPSVAETRNADNTDAVGAAPEDRVSEVVLRLIRVIGDAGAVLPELRALASIRDEKDAVGRQLIENQKDADEKLRKLQAELDAKDALLNNFGKQWMTTLREDALHEQTSADRLREKELEIVALKKAHKDNLSNVTKTLEDAASQHIEVAEKKLYDVRRERDAALNEVEDHKAKIEELSALLSNTRARFEAEMMASEP